ncbi:nucleolar protein 6 Mat89Ba [Bombus vancouverensis nearcticus]|uniref:Nucleolar protein 6 n=2 Tax=Bombus bifarius TaxID=103933 RepID=A0A6P8LNH4_9HYME|nr:nucleolar protein 6 isoform X1 [Bombus vancouverensis nearcticus]XP_033302081.1 nucleolar protein 6 isoform X1 [Bombus bifarius]
MKIPYKANINDFLNHSGNLAFENDHHSNDEIDEDKDYENEESEENEEVEKIKDINKGGNFLLVSGRKRTKVTNDSADILLKKKRKLDNDLYKPPTAEELNQLRETENLFHSNLFRLQIDEMLNAVRLKDKYKNLFDIWFKKFKGTIESIKETKEYELSDVELGKKLNMHISKLNVPKVAKGIFKFLKPTDISIIGSYVFEAAVGSNITVDIMIEMPAKMFQKQDYLNYRYIKKKMIYLAYIASNITDDIAESKRFMNDTLKPVLKIVPSGKLGTKINVLIHISAQEGSFRLSRFLPEKNNVRPQWFFGETKNIAENFVPTPHYNSIILHDVIMKIHAENMKVIREYPNIRDGIILLKIWLTQRELLKGYAAFNGHIITMLILYLLSIKKLNTFMSSYQIVRNVWNYLIHIDWCESGVSMNQNEESKDRILKYHEYYDCVFLDSTGYYNITTDLSKATYRWVQKEAELSLNHLDNAHANSFQSLFMRKVPFYMAFDHFIWFKDAKMLRNLVNVNSSDKDKLDYGPNYRAQAIKILCNTLKEGLANRVHQICVLPNESSEWECTEDNCDNIGKIFIGLELNPEYCFNIVDKGPEANLPEAIEFRNFWGEKSELRRFQDGTTREAVVWSKGKTLSGKRLICKKIVTFLLRKKLGILKKKFIYIASEMEELLQLQKVKITHFAYGTGEEAALRAINVFNQLEKDLMSLTDIPLSIHGVQGSSAVFRYTDVFPPLATVYQPDNQLIKKSKKGLTLPRNITAAPKYVCPLDVSLQLSTSGKWPDELEALRNTKAAFHIQIAECLRKQYKLTTEANFSHINVYKDGFVFRLRVAHSKEVSCLKQQITENGVLQYKDNEKSIELENKLFELPKLTSALHGLHNQQPSFGLACCLAKRWLSAQLLDNSHMPDIVVELLVASMYLMPAPYRPPQMPQIAFLRLLESFARGHWNTDPVIVNFNNEMSKDEIIAVETLFGSSRDSLPPLFISTPYDHQRSLWTKKAPSTLILNRITMLARQCIKLYEQQYFTKVLLDFKPLFRPPLTEYDCLIYLKPCMVPRRLQAIDVDDACPIVEWHPYKHHSAQKVPIVGFDPVQHFLEDLRNGYDEFALFFHDTYGGTVIGVLLRPSALEIKDLKVSNISGRKCNNNNELALNISAIIQDFYVLGKGLVEAIDVRSKKFSLT